jgi:hypothetical protein
MPSELLQQWLDDDGPYGIGLLMGSPFADGTRLGSVDIDRDDLVEMMSAILGHPPCGRIGSKGVVYFVRWTGPDRNANAKFRFEGEEHQHAGPSTECLLHKNLCLIPPTIHPDTDRPYRWTGPSLLEVDYRDLPVLEAV